MKKLGKPFSKPFMPAEKWCKGCHYYEHRKDYEYYFGLGIWDYTTCFAICDKLAEIRRKRKLAYDNKRYHQRKNLVMA